MKLNEPDDDVIVTMTIKQFNDAIIEAQAQGKKEILDLVSKAIVENCGLTVAEGKQLVRRVRVALL